MIFDWVHGLFSNDLPIDLGTTNSLKCVEGKRIVPCEPSVVAVWCDVCGGNKESRSEAARCSITELLFKEVTIG